MPKSTDLDRLCVHESVENVIPKEAFVAALEDGPLDVELIGDQEPITEMDAVATYVPHDEFLDAGWVHCIRAGYDEFDTERYRSTGVPLTNSTGIHETTVSEVALGFMLSLARNLHVYRDHQAANEWYEPDYHRPFTLENERICVVGLGTIGRGIAKRADALGMDVIGIRRSTDPVPGVSKVFQPDELNDAIADARFVALTVPHTPSTEHMIDESALAQMRDDAYLINVARGPLVDEAALVDALERGEISGAGLDVFETEPLPEESPLWDFDEVMISPHKGSATNRYHVDIANLVKENIDYYLADEDLRNRVA
ncbi:D-2-hydroxyacid dehydrogenase [Halorubrum sp. Ea8]|uniref:D-2-hydroxyacid dehydrogenase n=1 Tax=Halorubrum sp. Ea8 TaxID=1383841 RepID=UPI000B99345D|nr:D-2-hydroxyacid dehydrogenase [Halorubrum sp. Ea8]OYR51461.1 hydroxyacid dehydrogenase [Halorubrum sp. Ea8]